MTTKTLAATLALAALALAAGDLSASAQSSMADGYGAGRPVHRRHVADGTGYASRRPLTVRRTFTEAPAVVVAPVAVGPGVIVTGPLGFASNVVSLPFRAINGIFPATGDIATNPLVLIGAPLHAIGDIVQLPFRVIGAPFGGTTIATY